MERPVRRDGPVRTQPGLHRAAESAAVAGRRTFVVGGFCANAEAWVFTETNSGTQDWLIGPLGISGTCSTKGLWVHGAASAKPVLQANTNDFAVGLKTCLRQNGTLTLNTTGDGEGHVITLDAGIYDTGKLVIAGKGKVVCNATLQVTQSGTVALGGNLTLADGSPKWALRVRVVNGNIVLVCSSGTSIIVR